MSEELIITEGATRDLEKEYAGVPGKKRKQLLYLM